MRVGKAPRMITVAAFKYLKGAMSGGGVGINVRSEGKPKITTWVKQENRWFSSLKERV